MRILIFRVCLSYPYPNNQPQVVKLVILRSLFGHPLFQYLGDWCSCATQTGGSPVCEIGVAVILETFSWLAGDLSGLIHQHVDVIRIIQHMLNIVLSIP